MDNSQYGLVTSIFAFGGLCGALMGGPLSNKHGRRGSLLLLSILFTIGGAIMTVSWEMWVLALGRFVSGIASGAAVVVVPLYIHEVAPAGEKGAFGAITQISVNLGILLTQVLGLFWSQEILWRSILGVGGLLGAIQAVLLLKANESPKWLVSQGWKAEAEQALQALRGGKLSVQEIDEGLSDGLHASGEF